jgi:uncharacterized protein (TIGR03437 family)
VAMAVTATASSAGAWLLVSPVSSTSPSSLVVSIAPVGLAAGVYSGSISIATVAGIESIPVTLTVAAPPALAVSPSSLTFSYTIGAAIPQPQTLLFSGGAPSPGISATASSAGDWLTIGALAANGGVSVFITPSKLAAGVFRGAITVIESGVAPVSVPVTLIVTSAPSFSASPNALIFNAQLGVATRQKQFLIVSAVDPNATFTASPRSLSGLSVDTTGPFLAGQQVGVSIDSSNLQAGTYVGNILINGLTSSQVIPVTVFVGTAPVLTTSPASLAFTFQSGGAALASQIVTVNANAPGVAFSASATSARNWLSVSPATGSTPGALTVSVAPSGLSPAVYSGSIAVSGAGGSAQTLPVSLTVAAPGQVTVSPTSLEINYQVGDPNPSPPSFTLSGPGLTFTAVASSAGNWLAVNPISGTTPSTLSAQVSPAGLAAGSYTGLIQISPTGQAIETITITLNVHAPQNLTLNPSSLSFAYQTGGVMPASQIITVACANSALSFRPTASSAGNWLSTSVPNAQGNNQIIVSVNPAGLASGSYSGTVTIFGVGACNTTQSVPVTLAVSGGAGQLVTSNASSLAFSYQIGAAVPAAQTVPINCSGAVETFIVSNTGSWLRTSPASALTPATLNVSVDPAGLAAGSYTGSATITFYGACTGNQTVSVTLVVTTSQPLTASTLTFSAAALSFMANAGGAAPAAQAVSLTCGSGAAQFQAATASNGGWLSVSPPTGTTPGTLTVAVNPAGLVAGSYAGSINATATGCGATPALPVTLTVNAAGTPVPAAGVTITPASLTFSYQTGGTTPADQTLQLTGATGLPFTATASSAGWLFAGPPAGITPGNVVVTVDTAGLLPGTYSGVILIATGTGASGASQNVGVSLTVSMPMPGAITAPLPTITSLVSGASFLPSPLAPGEIISLFGRGLGPSDSVPMRLTPGGLVDNSLSGTRVIIDGTPAPMLYTQAGLVSAIVPFSVAGKSTVQVQVEYQGVRSAPVSFLVAAAAPAIFSIDGSGRGQGAILDQDTSVNSDLNPADRGSVIVLYASGAGQMDPPSDDGAITGDVLATPLAAVSVLVDGQNTEILYAGAAPGLVAGVLQVNLRLPPQISTGSAVGILLKVGRFTSQPGVTVAIR